MTIKIRPTTEGVKTAASIISRGGVIVYPTDTVYGIGCDVFNTEAVKRIYEVKKRDPKPMPVLCKSISDIERVGLMDDRVLTLANIFWPGPVSILVPKLDRLPDIVTAGNTEVAVRIPDNLIILEVMERAGTPIVGTSANISGQPPPATHTEISSEIINEVDAVIEAGYTKYKKPSTVIKLKDENQLLIIREGALKIEDVVKQLSNAGLEMHVKRLS